MAGYVPKWSRESQAKGSVQQPKFGIVSRPIFHTEKAPQQHGMSFNFADGTTEEQYKLMGLEASNRDLEADRAANPGIGAAFSRTWDRLKAGNVDAPGSVAYDKYGAGRGRAEERNKAAAASNEVQANQTKAFESANNSVPKSSNGATEAITTSVPSNKMLSDSIVMSERRSEQSDKDKKNAMAGKDDGLAKPSDAIRPMGDPAKTKKTNKTKAVRANQSNSSGANRSNQVRASNVEAVRGKLPAQVIAGRTPIVSDKTPVVPPADNETRKSKPYPAKAAAFKQSSDKPSRQVPGVASQAEIEKAAKDFTDLDKAYNDFDPKDALGKESLRLLRDAAKRRYEAAGIRK